MGILQARILEWVAMPSSRGSRYWGRGFSVVRLLFDPLHCWLKSVAFLSLLSHFPFLLLKGSKIFRFQNVFSSLLIFVALCLFIY